MWANAARQEATHGNTDQRPETSRRCATSRTRRRQRINHPNVRSTTRLRTDHLEAGFAVNAAPHAPATSAARHAADRVEHLSQITRSSAPAGDASGSRDGPAPIPRRSGRTESASSRGQSRPFGRGSLGSTSRAGLTPNLGATPVLKRALTPPPIPRPARGRPPEAAHPRAPVPAASVERTLTGRVRPRASPAGGTRPESWPGDPAWRG